MAAPVTVDDLVDQVRDQIDEFNRENITDSDILQALNRAQDYAVNILAREYEEPLLADPLDVPTSAGVDTYDIPEDALEDRIEKLEVNEQNLKWEIKRISYRDISLYETNSQTSRPYHYVVLNRKFRLVPTPSGQFSVRLWYLKEPEKLVECQGRITTVNDASTYVRVDSLGDDLTTESDELKNYVNLIDGATGEVKATMQIQSLDPDTGQITFKTTPDRTSVQGKTVVGAFPTDSDSNVTVEVDDYVALIQGSCVPFFKRPFSNFLIQYATNEIKRRLGEDVEPESRMLASLEKHIERQWVGREQTARVTKRNKNWHQPFRRYFTS